MTGYGPCRPGLPFSPVTGSAERRGTMKKAMLYLAVLTRLARPDKVLYTDPDNW